MKVTSISVSLAHEFRIDRIRESLIKYSLEYPGLRGLISGSRVVPSNLFRESFQQLFHAHFRQLLLFSLNRIQSGKLILESDSIEY